MRIVVGVTGGFGVGKSTVCRIFESRGAVWISADELVHALYLPGGAGYKKIQGYFGDTFVGPNGVHRAKLRRLVLSNAHKLWILNKLMHPIVLHAVQRKLLKELKDFRGFLLC
ncbi:MAG: dephospho-CoA kinase, partial [Candidatus Peregrinibacteria bacterium GW2011_GWA2_47_7]